MMSFSHFSVTIDYVRFPLYTYSMSLHYTTKNPPKFGGRLRMHQTNFQYVWDIGKALLLIFLDFGFVKEKKQIPWLYQIIALRLIGYGKLLIWVFNHRVSIEWKSPYRESYTVNSHWKMWKWRHEWPSRRPEIYKLNSFFLAKFKTKIRHLYVCDVIIVKLWGEVTFPFKFFLSKGISTLYLLYGFQRRFSTTLC